MEWKLASVNRTQVVATAVDRAKRITMAEVAAAAEVSIPTVSKVLNRRIDVSANTRRRVEEVIQASGYARNKPRKEQEPWLIDLVFSEFGPYATEIIKGAEEAALLNKCRIAVSALTDDPKETRWLDNLGPGRTDGIVLVFAELSPQHRERLKGLGIPVVIVDPTGHPDPRTPSVGVANWAGGMLATEHLIGLGHRRIGLIAGRTAMLCHQARLDGYRAALERAGLAVDSVLIATGAHRHPSALRAAAAMLELPEPPTAIFATTDLHAMGVYEAARLHGLRLPDDLSVIGFDDIPMAEWVSPPLTTMHQPLAQMAVLAVRMLLGKEAGLRHRMEFATSLVVRSSTAPPRVRGRLSGTS
jgi:LacI family transcriptional regulator